MTQEQILEQKSENYAEKTVKQCVDANIYCDEGSLAMGFIAGATSKYVEKQKLEFAIEQLKQIESHYKGSAFGMVQSKIKELEQKLQEL